MPATTSGGAPDRLGSPAYVVAGLSFIPLIGLVFALIAIGWGIATRKSGRRNLLVMGTGGIAFSVVLYGALFYFGFVQRGGVYDHLRAQLAQTELNTLVHAVEFYKVQHGSYPTSLKELQASLPKNSLVGIYDPTVIRLHGGMRYFFYERIGDNHYYLRGVGPDGKPFDDDDIVPQVIISSGSGMGLLLAPPAGPGPAKP